MTCAFWAVHWVEGIWGALCNTWGPGVSSWDFSTKLAHKQLQFSFNVFSKVRCEEINCQQRVELHPGPVPALECHHQLARQYMRSPKMGWLHVPKAGLRLWQQGWGHLYPCHCTASIPYRAEKCICCWRAASIWIETNQSHPTALLTWFDLSDQITLHIRCLLYLFSFRKQTIREHHQPLSLWP